MHLVSRSVTFTYCYDRPLQCIATQYKPDCTDRPGLTLLFAGGLGLNQETWQPIIQEIFRISSKPCSSVKIRSAWVVERPNHGDAALLNAKELKEHYTELFLSLQYATAIQTLLNSDELSPAEKENIVGVGFSGGCAGLVQCHQLLSKQDDCNFTIRSMILVECPYLGMESFPYYKVMYPFLRKANSRRPKSWKSVEDAMAWMGTQIPWSTFHPDIMRIIAETHFYPDPHNPGCVTTKTSAEQETVSFIDDGSTLQSIAYLRTVIHRLPVHLILSSSREFWLPEIQKIIAANVKQDRPLLASYTEMQGKGHYLTADFPYEIASRVVHILKNDTKAKL